MRTFGGLLLVAGGAVLFAAYQAMKAAKHIQATYGVDYSGSNQTMWVVGGALVVAGIACIIIGFVRRKPKTERSKKKS